MKKTVQYIALAALTLSLAACQQDNALQEINDPNAVKINATIGALQSRVTYDGNGATSFSNGDGIKVQNTKRTSKNEATYTYNGTTWSIQEGSLVWNSGENTNQFNAWYPATASYDSFELPTDQSDASKLAAADWMTATTVDMSKPSNCELGLTFAHKLAKVTVNISETHGSQFDNPPTLDEVKIYTHDGTKTITPMAGTNSYTAIVTPGQYNGPNNFMTFKVGEDEFTVKPTTTLTTGLEAGKHYTFTLTVGKDKATIGNVSVADWGTSQEITGGVAEEVKTSCNLPIGTDFRYAISAALYNNSQLTKIEFKANSNVTSETQIGTCGAYLVPNNSTLTLEIHTAASEFVFPKNCGSMFNGTYFYAETGDQPLLRITSINFNNCVNTSNVTDMNNMFRSLSALEELDLSCFDTSNVTDMSLMFAYCSMLERLYLSSFNVDNVENFANMLWMRSELENGQKTRVYVPNPNPFENKNTGINTDYKGDPVTPGYAEYVIGTPQ